jgi:hypothetical protein
MQLSRTRSTAPGFTAYVTEHRFGLTMLVCALVLTVMLAVVYDRVGFLPVWASISVPAPS